MSSKSAYNRIGSIPFVRALCLTLCGCLLIGGLTACEGSPDNDKDFFEFQLRTQAASAGEQACLDTMSLSRVENIRYVPSVVSSMLYPLENDSDRAVFVSLLTNVSFTRLTDENTPADSAAVQERTSAVVQEGLLFTYSVRGRDTEGAVYFAPNGQSCWFTSDGTDVYISEVGSTAYATAQSLGFKLMYGSLIPDGIGTETAS